MNDTVVKVEDCDVIKCSNCNKDLLVVKNKTVDKSLATKIQVNCPFCGDHSYNYETKGQLVYHPAKGIKITGYENKNEVMKFLTSKEI